MSWLGLLIDVSKVLTDWAWRAARRILPRTNPAGGSELAQIARGDDQGIDTAVFSTAKARGGDWDRTPVAERNGVPTKMRLSGASRGMEFEDTCLDATRAMTIDPAPRRIRVTAINPVVVGPPLLASFPGEDIAHAACFLCSNPSSPIAGDLLVFEGGRCK